MNVYLYGGPIYEFSLSKNVGAFEPEEYKKWEKILEQKFDLDLFQLSATENKIEGTLKGKRLFYMYYKLLGCVGNLFEHSDRLLYQLKESPTPYGELETLFSIDSEEENLTYWYFPQIETELKKNFSFKVKASSFFGPFGKMKGKDEHQIAFMLSIFSSIALKEETGTCFYFAIIERRTPLFLYLAYSLSINTQKWKRKRLYKQNL